MPRAIIYRRVSTDDQAEHGSGLDAQDDACRAWCEREGYEPIGPFTEDGGLSGSTPLDRCPALTEAVNAMARGDVLLVQKRDRVARDRMKIAMLEALVKSRKCRLVSASGEGTDTENPNDPMAMMMRGIVDLFAEFERCLIAWRVRGALAAKKKRNERTGRVPFGKDLVDDGRRAKSVAGRRRSQSGPGPIALVPNQVELDTLDLMFTLRRRGWSARRIAWSLNGQGLSTKTGKPWQPSSVHYICNAHAVTKGNPRDFSKIPAEALSRLEAPEPGRPAP